VSGFNLVPEPYRQQRVLRRHLRCWAAASLLLLGVIAVAGIQRISAEQRLQHLQDTLRRREALRAQVEQECTAVQRERDALVARAEALIALRREHPLPAQLLQLANAAPDGVVLTRIEGRTPGTRHTAKADRPSAAAATGKAGLREPQHTEALRLEIDGYAIDHQELMRLIRAMQGIEHWRHVSTVRVSREPLATGSALAFQLWCEAAENAP